MTYQIWREREDGHVVAVGFCQGQVLMAALIISDEEIDHYLTNGIGTDNDAELAEMVNSDQDMFDWICG